MTEIGSFPEPIRSKNKQVIDAIRRPFAVTGMTAKTRLREGESLGPERTLDERFERGEMFRIIKRIRSKRASAVTRVEKEAWDERLSASRKIFEDLASKLDVLNRQYYNPEYMQFVGVEVLGEQAEIPVRRYSLRDKNAAPEDKVPPPIIIIGGATSGPNVTKSTAEAFALQYPNRDVYVIGYPDSNKSQISEALPGKMKGQGDISTYAKINKDVLLKMGWEKFDLVGISMGGGIVLQAATDPEFAKRINNLIVISPTSIQKTEGMNKLRLGYVREGLYQRTHPRQWLRVPQVQPGYTLGSHKGMGLGITSEILRHKALSSDDLLRLHVQGRVIILTGGKDAVISCKQIEQETEAANEKRTTRGERPIEFMQIRGGHHYLGDVYAAGLVAQIRNTNVLPNQIGVEELPVSTSEIFVREDPRLAPVANQILR